jgi:DNA helicase-2/ATP-dependent DNA helicase PcrA
VQDLNTLQLALVDLLAVPDATIVYLGDEQQAIFSFIGAKLETLEALKRRCGDNIHHLHTNYRSPRYLLDLQNDYAVHNLGIRRDMLPTTDDTTAARPEDLCLLDVGDATLESYYTARFAKRYGDMDAAGNDNVAVLVSTNREADEVGEVMTSMGIPHFKISGTDLFSLPAVRLLLAHLSVLADETVFIAWARLLWGLNAVPTYTAARALMRDMRRVALLPSDFLIHSHGGSYLQAFIQAYESEELVIFDTETTGLDPRTDDIIQIAAIRVRQGREVGDAFNILLATDRPLPATVGGKPNPMIEVYKQGHPVDRAEGLRRFLEYCRGSILVGHNVEFDYSILLHNLRRHCPDVDLDARCPQRLDTLKYIRLVRPRLRHYKLGHLLETLHLEGSNSHRADDDIRATLALLRFCHTAALTLLPLQQRFLDAHKPLAERFRSGYADDYRTALDLMHSEGYGIVQEMQRLYNSGLVAPVDKWKHLIHYLEADLLRPDRYPTLRSQIDRYVVDLCTSKEADMCGGSLQERFIISTVHKAKGLEFDTVIVYRAIDGSYPGVHHWTERQIQEDARRLFVALSRSRRHLCVLCDSYFGRSVHTLSPFLDKVRRHFTLFRRTPDGKLRCHE